MFSSLRPTGDLLDGRDITSRASPPQHLSIFFLRILDPRIMFPILQHLSLCSCTVLTFHPQLHPASRRQLSPCSLAAPPLSSSVKPNSSRSLPVRPHRATPALPALPSRCPGDHERSFDETIKPKVSAAQVLASKLIWESFTFNRGGKTKHQSSNKFF